MHQWFIHLFDERKDSDGNVPCFECGKKMHEDTYKEVSVCYSHLLEKKKYKNFAGDPDNVVIVHPSCHNKYTMTPKKAINQYNKMKQLKTKYNLI